MSQSTITEHNTSREGGGRHSTLESSLLSPLATTFNFSSFSFAGPITSTTDSSNSFSSFFSVFSAHFSSKERGCFSSTSFESSGGWSSSIMLVTFFSFEFLEGLPYKVKDTHIEWQKKNMKIGKRKKNLVQDNLPFSV